METLAWLLALAGTLAMAGGCSLRYDTEGLGGAGSQNDGGIYEGPDAAPGALHVQAVFPFQVLEGEGNAADPDDVSRVRPIPVVVAGSNFTPDTVIAVEGEGFEEQVVQPTISSDGKWAAFELRVPVDRTHAEEILPLDLTVQKRSEQRQWHLGRQMLPEFEQTGGVIDTDRLAADTFSLVDVQGEVRVVGSRPLRLFGTAGLSVSAIVAADAMGQAPGPGGCAGGALGMPAECGPGSGQEGMSPPAVDGMAAGGGGGGGFGARDASPGAGDLGGPEGGVSGRESLVPLPGSGAPADNRGAGGGGGGRIVRSGRPRAGVAESSAGGGSGGIVELASPGLVRLSGLIAVNGADGGPCGEPELVTGGGGGGSGGAILVRAGAELAGDASLQARGGSGGGEPAACAGGDGGVGRIRIDRPNIDTLQPNPAPFLGPVFLPGLPVVAREPKLPVVITGNEGFAYRLRVMSPDPADGHERVAVVQTPVTTANGVGEAVVTLFEGHNRLCAEADPEANLSDLDAYRESQNCLSIAYIPE